MLIALWLVVLELPESLEYGHQFLLVSHSQVVGRCLRLFLGHVAVRIQQGMQLIVEVVKRRVDTFAALGFSPRGLHHIRKINHAFDSVSAFGLCRIVSCTWIEEVTTTAETDG